MSNIFYSHLLASGSVDQNVLLWDMREGMYKNLNFSIMKINIHK